MKNIEKVIIPQDKPEFIKSPEEIAEISSVNKLSELRQSLIAPDILDSKLAMNSLMQSGCIEDRYFIQDFSQSCGTHLA